MQWRRPKINGLGLKKLSTVEKEALEETFNKEEVWNALVNSDGNKAPGPDGFNLKFIKENWDFIHEDFMRFMEEFYHNGEVVKDINHTFVALIPRCLNPNTMKDFRPISLVGSMYKISRKSLLIGCGKSWIR